MSALDPKGTLRLPCDRNELLTFLRQLPGEDQMYRNADSAALSRAKV